MVEPGRRGRALRASVATAAIAIAAVASSSAFAAFSQNAYEGKFPAGANCGEAKDIAILEPEGLIYVWCATPEGNQIRRFNLDGSPAPFKATAPYISGNVLTGDPGSSDGTLINRSWIAVDSSGSQNHGRLFVASDPNVDAFDLSGKFAFAIQQPFEGFTNNLNMEVGPNGDIYVASEVPAGRISKYTPELQEVERLYTFGTYGFFPGGYLRADTTGALWQSAYGFGGAFEEPKLRKWEGDQFTTELRPAPFGAAVEPRFKAELSPYVEPNPLVSGTQGIDVDLTDNDVYVDRGDRVEIYSQGTPTESSYLSAPPFGMGDLTNSIGLALTRDHHVYASTDGGEIAKFGPGDILPDVHTFTAKLADIDHTSFIARGKVELDAADGGTPVKDCKVEYGDSGPGSYNLGSVQCSPDPAENPPASYYGTDAEISASLAGLTTGQTYHYRISAENEKGQNFGIDRSVVPPFVLQVQTLAASELTTEGATLNGSLDPDGTATEYKFQYGVTSSYGFETALESAGSESGVVGVSTAIDSLPPGKTFHYRLVAVGNGGETVGADTTFTTASPPFVFGVRADEVSARSATVHASINPVGFETKYLFEYGSTPSYGLSVPATLTSIGSGTEAVEVTQNLVGLQAGITYHFRLVAENKWGTTTSPDTTFDFSPPSCPNDHVRQQTTASYLPDCRAYELVSPAAAGAALLRPTDWAAEKEEESDPYAIRQPFVQNRGFASSPARFSYWGAISAIKGSNSPVGPADMYMATRTNQGWVSAVPGWQGNDAYETGRKICSESQALCIDHSTAEFAGYQNDGSPLLANAAGKYIGRLPTNLSIVDAEHPTQYVGGQTMSGDFNHYVFSTMEFKQGFFGSTRPAPIFAPGGLSTGLGSAYDNDLGTRTVTIISKLPGGKDIPLEAPKEIEEKGFDFPGISPDGSHILMQTPAVKGSSLVHLFMRVNQMITYPVSRGAGVKFVGMTRDGGKVFFLTSAQLVAADTDTSVDLYMWQEHGQGGPDELTILSQGNGNGNTDSCEPSGGWTSECDVKALEPERAHPNKNKAVSMPGQDDLIAEEAGDVYFLSPELLDPTHPGVENEENLYVVHQGSVQLVSTLDSGTEIDRDQIAPDGRHAAFLTASSMTANNTAGFRQVYTYDVENRILRCASCDPDGSPPTADARASEGGRFMANDGRTFFSSKDELAPRDRNGNITDVYEYVDGRPQLITSGLSGTDFTGGSEVLSLFLKPAYTGLEAVSRDGTDVYFSTFETLVKGDLNGEFVKFYDARSGGGFLEAPELPPCAAADECHGADSSAPVAPVVASGTELGSRGNVVKAPVKKPKHEAKKKQRKKHKKRREGRGR